MQRKEVVVPLCDSHHQVSMGAAVPSPEWFFFGIFGLVFGLGVCRLEPISNLISGVDRFVLSKVPTPPNQFFGGGQNIPWNLIWECKCYYKFIRELITFVWTKSKLLKLMYILHLTYRNFLQNLENFHISNQCFMSLTVPTCSKTRVRRPTTSLEICKSDYICGGLMIIGQ